MPSPCTEQNLPALARQAITSVLSKSEAGDPPLCPAPRPRSWEQPGCCFVSLHERSSGRLRGCIGSLQAHQPLYMDVIDNARAAALRDPRFAALTAAELPEVRIEVSVLSTPESVSFATEPDLLNQLQAGYHGLIIEQDGQRATFLPAVWEQLPAANDFLQRLKQKAGIKGSLDGHTGKAWRYHCDRLQEV